MTAATQTARRPWPAEPTPQPAFDRWLDRIGGTSRSTLGAGDAAATFDAAGAAAAGAAVLLLTLVKGVPLAVVVSSCAAAAACLAGLGVIRAHTGLTRHRAPLGDALASAGAAAVVAWALGGQVWMVLDIVAVGLAVGLAFARLGSLARGCDHGRPAPMGIRYGPHAQIDEALVGIRLFPLQLVDASWLALISVTAIALLGSTPGLMAWWIVLGYGVGCFVLELGRGTDTGRRPAGLTGTQWLILAVLCGRIAYEEWLAPSSHVPYAVGLAAVAALAVMTALLRLGSSRPVVAEDEATAWSQLIADVDEASTRSGGTGSASASLAPGGVRISLLVDPAGGTSVLHSYTIEGPSTGAADRRMLLIAGLIAQRLPPHRILSAGWCEAGTFHLWIQFDDSEPRSSAPSTAQILLYRAQAFARTIAIAPDAARIVREIADAPVPESPISLVAD